MRQKREAMGRDESAFEQFVERSRKNMQRIARATHGAYHFDDVRQEAWLLAHDLCAKGIIDPALRDEESRTVLLSHLYQKLVHYTDRRLRGAISLDPLVEYGDDDPRALLDSLASDNHDNPLDELIQREDMDAAKPEPDAHHSVASAWLSLVRRFENDMAKVAQHLLISLSHAYRCYARAKYFAVHQQPAPIAVENMNFLPGPWRRFRLQRMPVQMSFTFDDELPL